MKTWKLGLRIFVLNCIFVDFFNILSHGNIIKVSCLNQRFPISILGTTCVDTFPKKGTWKLASEHCKQIGGSLLKIKDRRKNKSIQDYVTALKSTVYIGLSKEAHERVYKWIGESDEANYMGEGSFDYSAPTQQCVTMSPATQPYWNSGSCEEEYAFICEHSPAQLCPPGWDVNISGRTCIKAIDIQKTWLDARAHCHTLGGDLAVALNYYMDQFLIDHTYKREQSPSHKLPFWIGLNNVNSIGHYKWLDNVVDGLNYTNWYLEPITTFDIRCVETYDHGFGYWVPSTCTNQRPFLCEKLADCRYERYGMECPKRCTSSVCIRSQKFCNPRNGMCQNGCEDKKYGAGCSKDCSPHCGGQSSICDYRDGTCFFDCKDGYLGDQCNTACGNNTYGSKCSRRCSSFCGGPDKACDNVHGACKHGCKEGYRGLMCNTACSLNTFGANCLKKCSVHCRGPNKACDMRDGSCTHGCERGYEGPRCDKACSNNTYGANCLEPCSTHCGGADKACDNIDGSCKHGCQIGYIGSKCGSACSNLTYGQNCSKTCSSRCQNETCDFRDGFCMFGCVTGYRGFHCETVKEVRRTVYSFWAIVATTIFACLVVLLCLLPFILEKNKQASNSSSAAEPMECIEGEEFEEYDMVEYEDYYEEEEETQSVLSLSVLGDMVSGMVNKVKRGRFDNDYTYWDDYIGSDVDSLASTLRYDEKSTSNQAVPRVGRKKKKQETIVSDVDSGVSSRKVEKLKQRETAGLKL